MKKKTTYKSTPHSFSCPQNATNLLPIRLQKQHISDTAEQLSLPISPLQNDFS